MAVTEQVTILLKAKDQASQVIDGVGRKMGGLTKLALGATAATAAAATAMVAGLTKVVADGVGKAMEMEQRVADIASVMGMAANEVAPLQDLIANLGLDPKLKVNATEAADAIEMLAKNGLSMTEILDGAARATVLLANSTGGDFSVAADVATDAMAQFSIDAADMKTAVDQITGVTVNSKFTINDYALALAQAGGVASSVGVDFEDFNAVIAAISPLFASGSDAGTSFKTFLQRLIPQSNDATDAMRALGLFSGLTADEFAKVEENIAKTEAKIAELDPTSANYAEQLAELTTALDIMRGSLVEGQNAFFNTDGSMKSMTEIAGILQSATKDLSDEQKNQMLSTIFGTDAMRAAFGIMNAGEEDVQALKDKIGNVSAEESAATRMGTLKGALEILGGQYDALTTRIGEAFLPMFRNFTERIIEYVDVNGPAIVAEFGKLVPAVEAIVNWMFSVGIPAMGNFFLWIVNTVRDVVAFWQVEWPKMEAIVGPSAGNITKSVDSITESLNRMGGWFGDNEANGFTWGKFWETLALSIAGAGELIVKTVDITLDALEAMGTAIGAVATGNWGGVAEAGSIAAGIAQKMADFMADLTIRANAIEGRAMGGPVHRGTPYMVGEEGPELFVPEGNGRIVPNNQTSMTTNNYWSVNVAGSGRAADDVLSSVQLLTALYG